MSKPFRQTVAQRRRLLRQLVDEGRAFATACPFATRAFLERSLAEWFPGQRRLLRALLDEHFAGERHAP